MARPAVKLGTLSVGVALLSALSVLACGEGTSPVELGRVEAAILDDPSGRVALGPGIGSVWLAHHKNFGSDYFHGQLVVEIQLQLSRDGIVFEDLGVGHPVQISLQDEEAVTALPPAADLPVGLYRHLRVILRSGTATLQAGSTVGGSDLDQPVSLALEGGGEIQIDVTLGIPLQVSSGSTSFLILDLNSESWVTEDHLIAGSVPASELGSALTVGVPVPLAAGFAQPI